MREVEQESHGYFKFEQDSVQVIKFGNNLKGFKGNHNVLFDKIDGLHHILTDLCVQGVPITRTVILLAANTKDQC